MAAEKLSFPSNWISFFRVPFSRENTLTLFLVTAFPINFWAIIDWFRNIGSIAEENGLWYAIGVGAYMLSFALMESVVIFLAILFLSMLVPKKWGQEKSLAQVSALYLALAIGLLLEQSRALVEFPREGFIWRSVNLINNILTSSPALAGLIAAALAVASILAIHRSDRVRRAVILSIEKIALLSAIYLVLDLAAIVVVIIRNL